jgi:hypothetical protein
MQATSGSLLPQYFEEVSLGSCSQGQNRGDFKLRQLLRIVEFKLPEAIA